MAEKYFHETEVRLLKLSQVTNDYPVLLEMINSRPYIMQDDESVDVEFKQFYRSMYDRIKEQAQDEWAVESREDVENPRQAKVKCELCKYEGLVTIYHLFNKLNQNKLKVGSDCVKHFDQRLQNDIREIDRKQNELSRRAELEKELPGIYERATNWNYIISDAEILLPRSLETEYSSTGARLREITEKFQKRNLSPEKRSEAIRELHGIIQNADCLVREIREYIDKNISNKLIVRREYLAYLREKQDTVGSGMLDRFRRITSEIFPRLPIPSLMEAFLHETEELIEPTGFTIEGIADRGYIVSSKKQREIKLCLFHSPFYSKFGKLVFGENTSCARPTFSDVFQSCKICDEASYRIVFGKIVALLKNSTVQYIETDTDRVDFENIDYEYNDVYFMGVCDAKRLAELIKERTDVDRNENIVYEIKYREFVDRFFHIAYYGEGCSAKDIEKYIFTKSNKIPRADYYEYRKRRLRGG